VINPPVNTKIGITVSPLNNPKLHVMVPQPALYSINPAYIGPTNAPPANQQKYNLYACAYAPPFLNVSGIFFSLASTTYAISAIRGPITSVKLMPSKTSSTQRSTICCRASRVIRRRRIRQGRDIVKPTAISHLGPYLSAIRLTSGAAKDGMARARKIKPAPVKL
jgi:hypothetical protein